VRAEDMPLVNIVIARCDDVGSELGVSVSRALADGEVIRPEGIRVRAGRSIVTAIVEDTCGSPRANDGRARIINDDVVHDTGKITAGAGLDAGPLGAAVQVRAPETRALAAAGGRRVRIGGEIIHKLH